MAFQPRFLGVNTPCRINEAPATPSAFISEPPYVMAQRSILHCGATACIGENKKPYKVAGTQA